MAAPHPHVQLGRTEVEGAVEPDIVHRIIRAHVNEVRHCYGQALTRDPELSGTLVLALTLGGKKTVTHSSVVESSLAHPRTEVCISTAAARWAFSPSADSQPVEVRQTMLLQPG